MSLFFAMRYFYLMLWFFDLWGHNNSMCKTERKKKKRTKMCCIKRSHDRGIADDKVRKLENIDNFWKQNTLCKRWNVGYMSVLEWCGSLGWNPSPVEHNGNFSFHCNKIKFSLAPRFKSMWRCSEVSSLETKLLSGLDISTPSLPCSLLPCPPELKAGAPSLLKYLTEGNSTPPPPSQKLHSFTKRLIYTIWIE